MATCRMCGDPILGRARSLSCRTGPVPVCADCRAVALQEAPLPSGAAADRVPSTGLARGPLELTGW